VTKNKYLFVIDNGTKIEKKYEEMKKILIKIKIFF